MIQTNGTHTLVTSGELASIFSCEIMKNICNSKVMSSECIRKGKRTNGRAWMWQVGVTRLALFGPLPARLCVPASAGSWISSQWLTQSSAKKMNPILIFLYFLWSRQVWKTQKQGTSGRVLLGIRSICASSFLPFFDGKLLELTQKVTQLKGNPCLQVTPEVNLQFDFSPNTIRMMIHRSLSSFTTFSYKHATQPTSLHKLVIAGSTCSI